MKRLYVSFMLGPGPLPCGLLARVAPCWEWPGFIDYGGYGRVGGTKYAHRVIYEAAVGPIPPGLVIDHVCHNRKCVNPNHLEAVTQGVNALRSLSPIAANGAKTRCPYRHLYAGTNLLIEKSGDHRSRKCRVCKLETRRRWHLKHREKNLLRMQTYNKRKREERSDAR